MQPPTLDHLRPEISSGWPAWPVREVRALMRQQKGRTRIAFMGRLKVMPKDSMTMRVPFWAVTIVIMSTYSSVLARAQLTDAPERAAILNGLAPDRAGRISGASVDGRGIEIAPSDVDVTKGPRESLVAGPAAAALAPPQAGSIDAQELASEIAERFQPLAGCRIDVARRRRVSIGAIAADRLTLRWTITERGQVASPEAVGTTAVDDAVLDCVKREMKAWTFSSPSGGPLPVERLFRFRPVLSPGDPPRDREPPPR